MATHGYGQSSFGLDRCGIDNPGDVYWNLTPAELYEHAVAAGEGTLAHNGALVCNTGAHTGRTPRAKYVVKEPSTMDDIWWGSVNQQISEEHFEKLHQRVLKHVVGKKLYVRDMYAGADTASQLRIRVITEAAWHNLFAAQLFIRPPFGKTVDHEPQFTVIDVPSCEADPETDGTSSSVFVVLNFAKRLILIGGTAYAGEIKKSIFTVMNYMLPTSGVLSMHCSANVGATGDAALFFGLSGTGKTTLSADPNRRLVGDDEHGWSDRGVFNIEGGCYAKCIKLSEAREPQIFRAIRFGAVLENVVLDPQTRQIDYESDKFTENTRVAYPVNYIHDAVIPGIAGHPKNVLFLTCDAFGVLPPISKLTANQAMYHFLSGYTAKVAGTEAGVTEPQATFSACFGAPFLPLPPSRYAKMLGERIDRHESQCWLVNTGWTGGPYGVGQRMDLRATRAMVAAALEGKLSQVVFKPDPVFGFGVPQSCPDVSSDILSPRGSWRIPEQYDAKARDLARRFVENFQSFEQVGRETVEAGPRL